MLWVALGCLASDDVALDVTLTAPVERAEVVVEWAGETRSVELEGSDGQLSGRLEGPAARLLPVRLEVEGEPWVDAMVVVNQGDNGLHFAAERDGAVRVTRPGTVEENRSAEQRAVGFRAAWFVAVMALVLWLVRRGPQEVLPEVPTWALGAIWAVVAVLVTWPAVLAGGERMVGRQFDLLGTVWILDAIPRIVPALVDPATAFPQGADYQGMDSWTLVPFAVGFQWLHPARLHGWLQVLGVASSGFAASWAARGLGAKGPWVLLAGAGFVLGGLTANVLVEGHAYHVMNPWLPLLALSWWRATGPDGTVRDGLLAGLFFDLSMLTTGYLAVASGVVVGGFFVAGLVRRSPLVKPAAAALATTVPVVALVFLSVADTGGERVNFLPEVVQGSVDLTRMLGATLEVDRVGHGLAVNPPATVLALAALAPVLLGRTSRWRTLVLVGLGAFVLSLGPAWKASTIETLVTSPLAFVWDLPGAALLRFPARLAWAWMLVLGFLAALSASRLRPGRLGGLVLALALVVDVVWVTGLPTRQRTMSAATPDLSIDGPVFDLLPEGVDTSAEVDAWTSAEACYRQTAHGQPIAEDCVAVPVMSNPRFGLGRDVAEGLLRGELDALDALRERGFTTLTWSPDLVHPGARARVEALLAELGEPRVDQGLHVYDLDGRGHAQQLPPVQAEQVELLLRLPPGWKAPASLDLALTDAAGVTTPIELSRGDIGRRAGESEAVRRAVWTDPGPGPLTLEVAEDGVLAWSGTLAPAVAHERVDVLLFRELNEPLTGRQGLLVSPSHASDSQSRPGMVALAGWGAWILLGLGAGVLARRRR